jgi:hypothetical protein
LTHRPVVDIVRPSIIVSAAAPAPSPAPPVPLARRASRAARPPHRSAGFMNSRIAIALLCVGALAFACGPRTHSSEPQRTSESTVHLDSTAPLASSLRVSVENGVNLAFHVTNATDKKLELSFPSGQTHDFVVLDSARREVWRWSSTRLFTQAMQRKMLGGGETMSFDERWHPERPAAGSFTAIATLTSDSHRLESRVDFRLP